MTDTIAAGVQEMDARVAAIEDKVGAGSGRHSQLYSRVPVPHTSAWHVLTAHASVTIKDRPLHGCLLQVRHMTAYGLQRLDEIKAGFQQTMDRWVLMGASCFLPAVVMGRHGLTDASTDPGNLFICQMIAGVSSLSTHLCWVLL
jgi:hypothetical protein